MNKTLTLAVNKVQNERLALTNCVYLSPDDAAYLTAPEKITGLPARNYVMLKDFVYCFQGIKEVMKGEVGLSAIQRNQVYVALNEKILVEAWMPRERNVYAQSMRVEVDYLTKGKERPGESFESSKLQETVLRDFLYHCFTPDQKFVIDFAGVNLSLRIASVVPVEASQLIGTSSNTLGGPAPTAAAATPGGPRARGVLMKQTELTFVKAPNSVIKITGEGGVSTSGGVMFRPDWNFETMGIGGLDREFSDIFRRAFASRVFPPAVIQKLGINHVRGLLLHGPPGTGKTLMARQIGKMLNGKEPKVVSGPEILSKYVGESEANIRKLFADAEMEQKAKGDESDLHIIIFDEIDALCRQRGTRNDGTGVGDTVVNQILAKIDGVEALNNILVIGMTNRKELIDEALLRPGRLEVHMEISLPDEKGRVQILRIHTAKMTKSGLLDPSVDLAALAQRLKNFSGAEIEGLVKSASSFALNRQVNPANLGKGIDASKLRVMQQDFDAALAEVKPAFGASRDEFEVYRRNGLIHYGARWEKLLATAQLYISQCLNSTRTSLVSLLLEGRPGAGKTALAASLALMREIPYVKLISPDDLVGYGENAKCARIQKVFDDAYKSKLSCVVVDDIERLLEYVPIGPRFSNQVLQTLLVLLKKNPPPGHRLMVIGTTSVVNVMAQMEVVDAFSGTLHVPVIQASDELKKILVELDKSFSTRDLEEIARNYTQPLPIKKLINLLEMTKQAHAATGGALSALFMQNIVDAGIAQASKDLANELKFQ